MSASAAELVLEHLLEAQGATPADDVAHKLGLSAADVYAAISALRAGGYEIGYHDHGPERGFLLLRNPTVPLDEQIARMLSARVVGRQLVFKDEVDSTNALARQLAEEGAPHGTCVLALEQTAGRGRRGRTWTSLPGQQLYTSVVLRPSLPAARAFELTILAAVALAEALEGFGIVPEIKWPNDVELDGRKVAGILAELAADEEGHTRFVVLGIGVNVDGRAEDFPEELKGRATSLRAAAGHVFSCAPLAAALYDKLDEWLVLHESLGFAPVLDSWRGRSSTLGAEVRALVEGQVVAGVAEDVDDSGELLVSDAAGRLHRIVAGDLTTLRRA